MNSYQTIDDLRERIKEGFKHTSDCIACSEALIWFSAESARKEYIHAWNNFGPTLSVINGSLLYALVLSFYKPLEPKDKWTDNESVNLRRILDFAGHLKVIDRTVHDDLKNKLRSIAPTWQKVKQLRDNLVAHGKTGLDVAKEMNQVGLTSSQWKSLYTVYAEVLNVIAEEIGELNGLDVELSKRRLADDAKRFFEALNSAAK